MFMFFRLGNNKLLNFMNVLYYSGRLISTDILQIMPVFYYFCIALEAALQLNQYVFDEPEK
jgi:hypothetical protein